MRHLVYNVTYFVLPINSHLLTITLYPVLKQHTFITTQITQSIPWSYNRVQVYP